MHVEGLVAAEEVLTPVELIGRGRFPCWMRMRMWAGDHLLGAGVRTQEESGACRGRLVPSLTAAFSVWSAGNPARRTPPHLSPELTWPFPNSEHPLFPSALGCFCF